MTDRVYPIFKGLQRPLEFMGIRGRFLIYAAALGCSAFFAFAIGNIIGGTLVGVVAMSVIAVTGYLFILVRQKQGLHSKKKYRGVVIYTNLFKH